jgi:hypothetical protein
MSHRALSFSAAAAVVPCWFNTLAYLSHCKILTITITITITT